MKRVFVKPMGDEWGVFEMGTLETIVHDIRKFGWRVGIHNALILLGLKKVKGE